MKKSHRTVWVVYIALYSNQRPLTDGTFCDFVKSQKQLINISLKHCVALIAECLDVYHNWNVACCVMLGAIVGHFRDLL